MKSRNYFLLAKFGFFYLYKKRLIRDSITTGLNNNEVVEFYNKVIAKAYSKFSAEKYIFPDNFTYDKILFSIVSADTFAKTRGLSAIDVINQYDHSLKYQIRDQADRADESGLARIWGQESVAIFNIFNSIKFSREIFDAVSFLGATVLDVGCSVGGASWLAWRRGARGFAISDMEGAALRTAYDTLSRYSGCKVNVIPINQSSDVPNYGKEVFDIALCLHTFEHTQDPVGLAEAILDSLKPGGLFIYTYYNAPVAGGINTTSGRDNRSHALARIDARVFHKDGFNLDPYRIGLKTA
jgi:2-polyprenyl-3-methyl-5-hydroxy-6-metoxy-1,4-benzoquinol methylase